jgi:hypothetical protein
MDPDADPDPAIFVMTFKIKSQKEDTKQYRNQGFSYFFCLVIEGSDTDPGGPKTYGSDGSGSATLIISCARSTRLLLCS